MCMHGVILPVHRTRDMFYGLLGVFTGLELMSTLAYKALCIPALGALYSAAPGERLHGMRTSCRVVMA